MKSLEHIIREMNEAAETNSDKRKEVKYVSRPDDEKPTSEKSKLGRTAVTKTNVIDEDGEQVKISGKKTPVIISPDENSVTSDKKEKIDNDAKYNKAKPVKEAVGSFANSPTIGVPKNKFTKGKPEQTSMKNTEGTPGQLTDDVQLEASKDDREYGYEGEMAMSQIKSIMNNSSTLMKILKPNTDLPEWVQAKITLAQDYIQTAADYMSTEVKEETDLDEAGAFSYGVKTPKKGSSAWHAIQMSKKDKTAPIEPKDQMVGNAKVTKESAEKIDEISQAMKDRYAARATGDASMAAFTKRVATGQAKKDAEETHRKRTKGLNLALNKEEKQKEQMDKDIFSEEELAWLESQIEESKRSYPNGKPSGLTADKAKAAAKAGLENAGGKTPAWLNKATKKTNEEHDDDGWYAHKEIHGDKGISKEDWKKGWRMNSKGQKVKLKEEAEQIDEISKARVKNYEKKAEDDFHKDNDFSDANFNRKTKRAMGLDLAARKLASKDSMFRAKVLAKEEAEQIEEAGKYRETSEDPKFHTHIQKAAGSAAEGATIDFKHEDGSTTKITPAMGKKLNTMFNGMKGGPAKADAVAQAHKSSKHLSDLMAGKVATAAKPWKPGDPLPTKYTTNNPPRKFGK